ncbi:RNA 3'-terminal phosphate cyclase [Parasphingopyxis sp. CP4]|uniref:RNA 3'-terminal phosphate cyclase n=1 Tax=Parasphingopyxis sp. CP4 TaxID=2724527 RepID=UPI0015A3B8A0|nr:RNA 3'-terminal phosphate cyclase [Parasphingopyxis sp. CP4]QLC20775.1 RNA 3'-terminal phosphate cyclase [Parasphingopyxis sp. CP4]
MITIDGSAGEGGGQILRTAVALALVTEQPFKIENIRGKRKKPGLMRQHLTSVAAACEIGNADCSGLEIGSSELVFRPGAVRAGSYRFAVGTAGSTGLVLQTILLPLALAGGPSHVAIEGGTHNSGAPPFDFLERSFLPILGKMGPDVQLRLARHGFFPRGGGRIEAEITPSSLRRIECVDRGLLKSHQAMVLSAGLPREIAEREIKVLAANLDWSDESIVKRDLPGDQGPGNIVVLESAYEQVTEVVAGFAKMGLPAERVAKQAAARMLGYDKSTAFAGPYLADQLLLPMALAGGGRFTTVKPSQHTLTNIDTIKLFTGRSISIEQTQDGTHLVRI